MKKQALIVLLVPVMANIASADIFGTGPADIDSSGVVDANDLAIFVNAWLSNDSPTANWNPACDISDPNDGVIDIVDFAVLALHWLEVSDSVKWSEGKSFMGIIGEGIRSYVALNDPGNISFGDKDDISYAALGLVGADFADLEYFTPDHFDWIINYDPVGGLAYEVSGFAAGTTITYPQIVLLNESGEWTEY